MTTGKKGFQPGQSGNPSGRKPGSKNRTTAEIQQAMLALLDDNLEALQDDLNSINGKDRVSLLISLAKHCTPPAMNPEKLTEEQLKQIIDYLKAQQNGN